MNDYIIVGIVIIGVICFIVGIVVFDKSWGSCSIFYGMLAMSICLLIAFLLVPCASEEYHRLPYLDPTVYELSEMDASSIIITGEKNSITFSDTDNVYHTITYEDLTKEYQEGATPSIYVYKREESSKWFLHSNPAKVVIMLPEEE